MEVSEAVKQLAMVICESQGKDPLRVHSRIPNWQKNIDLARSILGSRVAIRPQLTDDKLLKGLDSYIKIFNEGVPSFMGDGKFIPVRQMPLGVVNLHLKALKGAIEATGT